jgi:uncharacterized membrane protein
MTRMSGLKEANRLEAFSDGVLAIIITIMVLEFHVPKSAEFTELVPLFPLFLAYALSFVFIAIYWNNHHHLLKASRGVNASIMWANCALLFCLSLIPFATHWMGNHATEAAPTVLYGFIMLCSAVCYFLLQNSILATLPKDSPFAIAVGKDVKGKISLALYIFAIPAAFVQPLIAQLIFLFVAGMWVIPDARARRLEE